MIESIFAEKNIEFTAKQKSVNKERRSFLSKLYWIIAVLIVLFFRECTKRLEKRKNGHSRENRLTDYPDTPIDDE